MSEVPNDEEITVEDLYEEANEMVIQAEEAPWLCPFSITEMIVQEWGIKKILHFFYKKVLTSASPCDIIKST